MRTDHSDCDVFMIWGTVLTKMLLRPLELYDSDIKLIYFSRGRPENSSRNPDSLFLSFSGLL